MKHSSFPDRILNRESYKTGKRRSMNVSSGSSRSMAMSSKRHENGNAMSYRRRSERFGSSGSRSELIRHYSPGNHNYTSSSHLNRRNNRDHHYNDKLNIMKKVLLIKLNI